MSDSLAVFVFALAVLSFLAGTASERLRAKYVRRRWHGRAREGRRTEVLPFRREPDLSDPAEQLRIVTAASFEKRRVLSKSEARVFSAAEKAIREQDLPWRVMAQVSLGEVLSSPQPNAYKAINSKRVDVLIVSTEGEPVVAIEYQGSGHYQGTAPARDAVKKEALRKAGVRYIEVTSEHAPKDLAREIARIASVEKLKPGA